MTARVLHLLILSITLYLANTKDNQHETSKAEKNTVLGNQKSQFQILQKKDAEHGHDSIFLELLHFRRELMAEFRKSEERVLTALDSMQDKLAKQQQATVSLTKDVTVLKEQVSNFHFNALTDEDLTTKFDNLTAHIENNHENQQLLEDKLAKQQQVIDILTNDVVKLKANDIDMQKEVNKIKVEMASYHSAQAFAKQESVDLLRKELYELKTDVYQRISDQSEDMEKNKEQMHTYVNETFAKQTTLDTVTKFVKELEGDIMDQSSSIAEYDKSLKRSVCDARNISLPPTCTTAGCCLKTSLGNVERYVLTNAEVRHAFEVLQTKNTTYQNYAFLVLQLKLPDNGLSKSENWCRDYELLCEDFGRRPTGCGLRYVSINPYDKCKDIYNSNMYIGDVLSCNPSYRIAEIANTVFPNLPKPARRNRNAFGFHICNTESCQKTIKGSKNALYAMDEFMQTGDTTVYTVCR